MATIEQNFGDVIKKAARRYSPKGTDPEDTYAEILIAVHARVVSNRVDIESIPAMRNTIKQRAIDYCRREVLVSSRCSPLIEEYQAATEGIPTTWATEARELRRQIVRALSPIDAVLVCEMVFPSATTREFAKKRPFKRSSRWWGGASRGVVRKWHVAELYGVTTKRVTLAMLAAREMIGEILG